MHSIRNWNYSVVCSPMEILSFKNITYHCPGVYLIYKIILHICILLSTANGFIYCIFQNLDYSKNVFYKKMIIIN